jgi:SAM-dependent methyltransferase
VNHDQDLDPDIHFSQEFWDERYLSADRLWSGQPNVQLVAQAAGLPAGHALDAGSGEGADAIWLAARGWTVTAVDVSAVALERAARHASDRGEQIAALIRWQREDLLSWDPAPQRFDLVTAHFMHLPEEALRTMHRRLAAAVRPGGTLLIVGHHPDDVHSNVRRGGAGRVFPTATDVAAVLDQDSWDIVVAEAIGREVTDLDGRPATAKDTVLRAVRRR